MRDRCLPRPERKLVPRVRAARTYRAFQARVLTAITTSAEEMGNAGSADETDTPRPSIATVTVIIRYGPSPIGCSCEQIRPAS